MAKKAETPKNGASGQLEALKAVYAFMAKNGLESVEMTEEGAQIKLVRRKAATVQVPVAVPVAMGAAAYDAASPAPLPHCAPPPAGPTIKSPMMGIFYRAPSPSSPPFVKDGTTVKPGEVICMIEAMKVFNEIKAEFPCILIKVLVENGKPVKAGQDLFTVSR